MSSISGCFSYFSLFYLPSSSSLAPFPPFPQRIIKTPNIYARSRNPSPTLRANLRRRNNSAGTWGETPRGEVPPRTAGKPTLKVRETKADTRKNGNNSQRKTRKAHIERGGWHVTRPRAYRKANCWVEHNTSNIASLVLSQMWKWVSKYITLSIYVNFGPDLESTIRTEEIAEYIQRKCTIWKTLNSN